MLDSRLTPKLETMDLKDRLAQGIAEIEAGVGRKYGDPNNPLLLKIVCSSNLALSIYPTVFNIGLSPTTIQGFINFLGEKAAWFEYCYLIRTAGVKIFDIPDSQFAEIEKKHPPSPEGMKACAMEMGELVGRDKIPDDPMQQLEVLMKHAAKRYYDPDLDEDDNVAIMVQGIVFGNMGEDSSVGMVYTRDIVTGEDKLSGNFMMNAYTMERTGTPIQDLPAAYLDDLRKICKAVERKFREIREIKFIVEKKKLWLINQTVVDGKSTQSHLRTLLDLMKENVVEESWVVQQIPPGQLASLLQHIVEPASIASLPSASGGMTGSPGAAVGKVYFSADKVMEAHREAMLKGEDTRVILCVESSFAEDVKAIEVGQAVIAVEGGYSSHAPVVARSLGKVSILNQSIKIGENYFELNGMRINEGDYVTLDCPVYKKPTIYAGKAKLINPDINTNGLVEFISVMKKFISDDFVVRANADLGRDAKVARVMGAYGIGLCRTEHMFFQDDRIQRFREMILAKDYEERVKALNELRPMQKNDFYDLFKEMAPHHVTIRLLDAPLHEFLPRNDDAFADYTEHLRKKGVTPDEKALRERIERLHEFNPMLGHRGCRVAITYPEIYQMQVRGIFEAACQLQKEGVTILPEIMIPIVMNPNELTFIKNGKKIEGKVITGITDTARDVFKEYGVELEYKVGTMV
ncbi:MAG TPA: PEP-utilizing enzyme, partial [Leptospiraceae bacterium]|nr:PEP-utilizing enzyme [Leptospiraceae bacterium]